MAGTYTNPVTVSPKPSPSSISKRPVTVNGVQYVFTLTLGEFSRIDELLRTSVKTGQKPDTIWTPYLSKAVPVNRVDYSTIKSPDKVKEKEKAVIVTENSALFRKLEQQYSRTLPSTPPNKLPKKGSPEVSDRKRVTADSLADSKKNCAWNLPAHKWSLPYSNGARPENRLGKIYFYETNYQQKWVKQSGGKAGDSGVPDPKTADDSEMSTKLERTYGFEFMWNPETYSTQTALSTEVTVGMDDAFMFLAGMFPGTESIQITARLDRVNDFACFRKLNKSGLDRANNNLKEYYPEIASGDRAKGYDKPNDKIFPDKTQLDWLLNYGTMADIEYLYRVVNDVKLIHRPLKNGFKTADFGFLGYSLVGIELGPMFYMGFLSGISVNHTMFTEDYIPIRSDLTINANLFAFTANDPASAPTSASFRKTEQSYNYSPPSAADFRIADQRAGLM